VKLEPAVRARNDRADRLGHQAATPKIRVRLFDDQGFNDSGLKTRPSDLFRRNCWISFEPVEGSLQVLAEYIGPHKILWATDIHIATASSRERPR
jgi:hypothetical protein